MKTRRAVTRLVVLAISLLLFVLWLRWEEWSWVALACLVAVVFFHEAGHWLAMLLFGYRDLRMVFLPFLGAVVLGSKAGAPIGQRLVVLLAGPLPGIMLGLGLYFGLRCEPNSWLFALVGLLLGVNGLNLLPVLPLDGGRVFHLLLCAHQPWLTVGFRLVSGIILLTGAWLAHAWILGLLGGGVLLSAPLGYLDAWEEPFLADDSQQTPAFLFRLLFLAVYLAGAAASLGGYLSMKAEATRYQAVVAERQRLRQALALIQKYNGDHVLAGTEADLHLVKIDLRGSQVSDEELAALSGLTSLRVLDLGNCPEITDHGLAHLENLVGLEELYLGRRLPGGWRGELKKKGLREFLASCPRSGITSSGLAHLKKCTRLRKLDLAGTQVDDQGLELLRSFKDLDYLVLMGTPITDDGLANLEPLEKLTCLVLEVTLIGDPGLEHLKGLKNLQQVYLGHTQVTRRGLDELHQALPGVSVSH